MRTNPSRYPADTNVFEMLNAGWKVPEWLRMTDWGDLQLTTLYVADIEKLPEYTPDMPIILKRRGCDVYHIVEKTITLTVGKSRSFCFTDHEGEEVWCHINNVTLIDIWEQEKNKVRTLEEAPGVGAILPER